MSVEKAITISGVIETPQTQLTSTTPSDLLRFAMESGTADLDRLEKLYELQQRWEADQAKKAWHVAVAAFKSNPPEITKDKENKQYGSHYTSLANLVNTGNAALAPHGLNARWDIHQNGQIEVTCILSHVLGHSEQVMMQGPADKSGSKNELQQIKSTVTYLRGATFEAVTGIASSELNADDDANGSATDSAVVAQWLKDIDACDTLQKLDALGAKLAASTVGGQDRKALKPAYAVRKKALVATP